MDELQIIRNEINETDQELYCLLEKRFLLSEKVAESKRKTGASVFVPEREQEILKAIQSVNLKNSELILPLCKSIMTFSRSLQYGLLYEGDSDFSLPQEIQNARTDSLTSKKTGFCGDIGSYSEAAAKSLFPSSELSAFDNFEQVCEKVYAGDIDFGVLPLENTTAGTVNDVYDYFVKYNLYIVKTEVFPVFHCLSGIIGSKVQDIRTVCSHPQALAQCSDYIKEHGLSQKKFANTAFAAAYVSESGDKTLAAICSKKAAAENNLTVLCENINNESSNRTRFIALSKSLHVTKDADRISIVFSLPHESGALSSVLSVFAALDLNLLKIQSRPLRERPWEYYFYLDFLVTDKLESAYQVLYQLSKELPFCKFLGYYSEKNNLPT